MNNCFKKTERLSSKKDISTLFQKGEAFFSYPYRIVWTKNEVENQSPAQILISVSKRNFKKAVDRNAIKRYIREAYRTQKGLLISNINTESKISYHIAILYTNKEVQNFDFHKKAIAKLLLKFSKEILSK